MDARLVLEEYGKADRNWKFTLATLVDIESSWGGPSHSWTLSAWVDDPPYNPSLIRQTFCVCTSPCFCCLAVSTAFGRDSSHWSNSGRSGTHLFSPDVAQAKPPSPERSLSRLAVQGLETPARVHERQDGPQQASRSVLSRQRTSGSSQQSSPLRSPSSPWLPGQQQPASSAEASGQSAISPAHNLFQLVPQPTVPLGERVSNVPKAAACRQAKQATRETATDGCGKAAKKRGISGKPPPTRAKRVKKLAKGQKTLLHFFK